MQKIDSRKILLTTLFVLILVVVALLIGRISYGYVAPLVTDSSNGGSVTANGDALIFKKGGAISLNVTSDFFSTFKGNLSDKVNPTAVLIARSGAKGEEVSAKAKYNVGINITNNTFKYTTEDGMAELILTVRDENGTIVNNPIEGLNYIEVNGISGYDITGKMGVFSLDKDHVITSNDSKLGNTQEWTFNVTFINLGIDQILNENASLLMNVIMQTGDIINTPMAQG